MHCTEHAVVGILLGHTQVQCHGEGKNERVLPQAREQLQRLQDYDSGENEQDRLQKPEVDVREKEMSPDLVQRHLSRRIRNQECQEEVQRGHADQRERQPHQLLCGKVALGPLKHGPIGIDESGEEHKQGHAQVHEQVRELPVEGGLMTRSPGWRASR